MGLEGRQQFGPDALRRVPDKTEGINPNTFEKRSLGERMALTGEESQAYQRMLMAGSQSELRAAIDAFNAISTPKVASELGFSLDDMQIIDEPVGIRPHDLPLDAEVVATRDMREGVLRFRIKDR
ncbi:MAG TPA: hypothetical protein VGE48_01930 [Candidatus Paceibacterota bacterium]